MVLSKRRCYEYVDGTVECFRDGFWSTGTGIIVKWVILMVFFFIFVGWFLGGYLHAKARLRKGKPLLAYHRWLISYQERRRYGQVPQNHFAFYAHQPYTQQPYAQQQPVNGPRPDGTWPEPPPMYGGEAPPGYVPPPGATKMDPNQGAGAMEMGQVGQQQGTGPQQTGVVGGEGQYQQEMPPRPPQAKLAKLMSRFRR